MKHPQYVCTFVIFGNNLDRSFIEVRKRLEDEGNRIPKMLAQELREAEDQITVLSDDRVKLQLSLSHKEQTD